MQKFEKRRVDFRYVMLVYRIPFEGHTFRAAAAVPISPASSLGGSLLPFLRSPAVWGMGELEKVGTGCLNFKSRILGQVCNSVQHPHRRGDSEIQTPPCSASIFFRRFSWLKQIWWLEFRAWSCFCGDYGFYHGIHHHEKPPFGRNLFSKHLKQIQAWSDVEYLYT